MRISDWSSDVCSSDLNACAYQRINGALAAPCRLSDLQISVDCAIGCALSGHEEEELEDVLRQAQAAMKLAKKSGKLEIYRPGVLREARHRFNLESNLREALATGGLELALVRKNVVLGKRVSRGVDLGGGRKIK